MVQKITKLEDRITLLILLKDRSILRHTSGKIRSVPVSIRPLSYTKYPVQVSADNTFDFCAVLLRGPAVCKALYIFVNIKEISNLPTANRLFKSH
jgi:hypothetical protein